MPSGLFTDGQTCGELARSYGLTPDPWQQLVLDGWLTCRKDGTYTASTCGLSVPRQNGKNGVLEMVEVFKSAVQGRRVLHTAHEVKTARKHFIRMQSFFDEKNFPEMASLLKAVRSTNGQEAIILKNGGSIEFIARSKASGRGYTVDDLVCDEAQELTDEQLEAILPTISSAPSKNPQMILTGTPNPPESVGTVFRRTRNNAIAGKDKDVCWFEWSVDRIGDIYDKTRWAETNPALGARIMEKVIVGELATMSEEGFARERLGWWEGSMGQLMFSKEEWDELKVGPDGVPDGGKKAFGVKFTTDGKRVVVAGCVRPRDGSEPFVELIFDRPTQGGLTWLADWLYERRGTTAQTTIDGLSGTGALMERLGQLGYPKKALMQANTSNMVAAASMFLNTVQEGDMSHSGQPVLDNAIYSAERRDIGKSGGWGYGGIDPTPVEACALAYWGCATSRRNPGRGSKLL